jgi:hypothetical protein
LIGIRLALLIVGAGVAIGAPRVIGFVVANGSFRLDRSTVRSNATLFEGASVETGAQSSSMHLSSGAAVELGPESRGKIFSDRMILERGEGSLQKGANFRFEAFGLTIQPSTGNAAARVVLASERRVQVAPLLGSFRVLNSRGTLVANVAAGSALEFEPQASYGATRVVGCLQDNGGHFLLTDETTNVVVELAGAGVAKQKGHRVEAVGSLDTTTTPVAGASYYVRATSVKRIGKGCGVALGIAAAAGAGGAGAAGASTAGGGAAAGGAAGGAAGAAAGAAAGTISAVAVPVAVIGGVAAAGTVGGLAAAGKLPGQTETPISR